MKSRYVVLATGVELRPEFLSIKGWIEIDPVGFYLYGYRIGTFLMIHSILELEIFCQI